MGSGLGSGSSVYVSSGGWRSGKAASWVACSGRQSGFRSSLLAADCLNLKLVLGQFSKFLFDLLFFFLFGYLQILDLIFVVRL